jgi:hypothetical protein
VGAVLALTPLLTLGVMELAAWGVPGLVAPERLAALGWAGAATVVAGSMAVSLLARRVVIPPPVAGAEVAFAEDITR